MTHNEKDEQPSDPVLERLRGRMLRLMLISVGIMGIGIFAVIFAIIYKITKFDAPETVVESVMETSLNLPKDSDIVSSSTDNDRLVIHVRLADGSAQFLVIDMNSGRIIARLQ